MKVLRSFLLLILLVATCHGFAIMKNFTANAPTLEEIRDDFVDGVSAAADDLQRSIVHKVRATGGAVSTLGDLNANLIKNFLANNYNFWTNLGNGVSTKSSQLWSYISDGLRPNKQSSMSFDMPNFGMSGPVVPGPVMPGSGMPGSGMLSSWLSNLGKPLIIFPGSNLMGPGTGSGPISSGSGTDTGSGSFFPESGTNSPSSKFERLRSKFIARPGCSLWESINLPEPRQAQGNFVRSDEPEAIVKTLEDDEFSENGEINENDVVSS